MMQLGSLPDRELEKIGKALKIETTMDEDTLDRILETSNPKPKPLQPSRSGVVMTRENLERFNEAHGEDPAG